MRATARALAALLLCASMRCYCAVLHCAPLEMRGQGSRLPTSRFGRQTLCVNGASDSESTVQPPCRDAMHATHSQHDFVTTRTDNYEHITIATCSCASVPSAVWHSASLSHCYSHTHYRRTHNNYQLSSDNVHTRTLLSMLTARSLPLRTVQDPLSAHCHY